MPSDSASGPALGSVATVSSAAALVGRGGRASLGGPVGAALTSAVAAAQAGGRAVPAVLDCGGGSGSVAVPLARAGAEVTVVDISVDALATLSRRAAEAGVADRVHPLQADVESWDDAVPGAAFDLVLAHGILGAVDAPGAAFAAMAAAVRPGGVVSVVVGNPVAAVLARALGGDVVAALREFRRLGDPDGAGTVSPRTPEGVQALCAEHGLVVEQVHGVGVFADLVPGSALDATGARDALAELESAAATRRPFTDIAGRIHVLARRPG